MFLALVLAVTTATPAPSSLAPLKVIANVRSTPLCSALRTKIGPAIAALLENDVTIDKAPPTLDHIYQHQLLSPQWGWGQPSVEHFVDLGNLEYLIGLLANNLNQIDDLLADGRVFVSNPASEDELRLAQIKNQLNAIEAEQKAALNVISGYDATALTYGMLTEDISQGLHVSSPSKRSIAQFDSVGFFGSEIATQGPRSSPGRFDISLAYNPLKPFAEYITALSKQGVADETSAAAVIAPIVASCQMK